MTNHRHDRGGEYAEACILATSFCGICGDDTYEPPRRLLLFIMHNAY